MQVFAMLSPQASVRFLLLSKLSRCEVISVGSGPVAQRLEQWTHNPLVQGSNPCGPTKIYLLQSLRPMSPITQSAIDGGPGRSRTADQQFRKLLLYPSELRGRYSAQLPSAEFNYRMLPTPGLEF
jgi:hypothetical protein